MKNTKNERVRELRNQLNLTQAEMSKRLGITLTTLSRIENGYDLSPKIERTLLENLKVNKEWFEIGKGVAFPSGKPELSPELSSQIVWKDEAFIALKEEVSYLRTLVSQLVNGNPNFQKATDLLRAA